YLLRVVRGHATFQVRWHRHIDLLWMRQAQIRHVSGEVVFAQLSSEPRIEAPLLAHARHRQAAIVVSGIKQAGGRQRKNFAVDRPERRRFITALEIRAACPPNQQTVASKGHGFVVEYEADAATRVTWRRANPQ